MKARQAFMGVVVLLGTSLPVTAQTVEQAARTNTVLALQLCLAPQPGVQARAAAFRNAGFAEEVTRSTTNADTTHIFAAPGDTVTVTFYYGEMPEDCRVMTHHLGVGGGAVVLDTVVPPLHPTYVRRVTTGGIYEANGQPAECVVYEDPGNPIGHVIGVRAAGQSECIENGTSLFYSGYRV